MDRVTPPGKGTLRSIVLAACLTAYPATFGWAGAPVPPNPSPSGTDPFFEVVRQRAEALAQKPHHAPEVKLPDFLKNLDYEAYQHIRFRAERRGVSAVHRVLDRETGAGGGFHPALRPAGKQAGDGGV